MEGSMGQLDTWDTFCGWWALVTPIVRMGLSTCWEPPSHSPLGCFQELKNSDPENVKETQILLQQNLGSVQIGEWRKMAS